VHGFLTRFIAVERGMASRGAVGAWAAQGFVPQHNMTLEPAMTTTSRFALTLAVLAAAFTSAAACVPCAKNPGAYTVHVLDEDGALVCDADVIALEPSKDGEEPREIKAEPVNAESGCEYKLETFKPTFNVRATKPGLAAEQEVETTKDVCKSNDLVELKLAPASENG
jgi:hypothetical protein